MTAGPRGGYRPRSEEPAVEQSQIQIRLSTVLRDRLQKEAARRTLSVNYLAERAIEESLDLWESERLL